MTSGIGKDSKSVFCPLCHASMQPLSAGRPDGHLRSAWRCSRSPACGGLLVEDSVRSEQPERGAGSGGRGPLLTQRVTPTWHCGSSRPSRDAGQIESVSSGVGRVERIRLRPRNPSQPREPVPDPLVDRAPVRQPFALAGCCFASPRLGQLFCSGGRGCPW